MQLIPSNWSELSISIGLGLVAAWALRIIFSTISSEWPANYFSAKSSIEDHSRRNLFRYSLLRGSPFLTVACVVAGVSQRLDAFPAVAVLILTIRHLWTSTIRSLINLYKHERDAITVVVLVYHISSLVGVLLGAAVAIFWAKNLAKLVPHGDAAINAIWTASLAALFAAALKKATTFDKASTDGQIARAKADMGVSNWDLCAEAARRFNTDADLLRAIIVSEVLQRPGWARSIERLVGRFAPGSVSYGVAQMRSPSVLTDAESVMLLAESFSGYYPSRTKAGFLREERTKAELERHNRSQEFLDTVLDVYRELAGYSHQGTERRAPDRRPVIEVQETKRTGDKIQLLGTAWVPEGKLACFVDEDQTLQMTSSGVSLRDEFRISVPLKTLTVSLSPWLEDASSDEIEQATVVVDLDMF